MENSETYIFGLTGFDGKASGGNFGGFEGVLVVTVEGVIFGDGVDFERDGLAEGVESADGVWGVGDEMDDSLWFGVEFSGDEIDVLIFGFDESDGCVGPFEGDDGASDVLGVRGNGDGDGLFEATLGACQGHGVGTWSQIQDDISGGIGVVTFSGDDGEGVGREDGLCDRNGLGV